MANSCSEQAAELRGAARTHRAGFAAAERALLDMATAVAGGPESAGPEEEESRDQ